MGPLSQSATSATLIVTIDGDDGSEQVVWHFRNPGLSTEHDNCGWYDRHEPVPIKIAITTNETLMTDGDPEQAVAKMFGSLAQQIEEAKQENARSRREGYRAAIEDLRTTYNRRYARHENEYEEEDGDYYDRPTQF